MCRKLKENRKRIQEANVRKKEELKKKGKVKTETETQVEEAEDNDAEWYRQEVGAEPDPGQIFH